MEIIRLIITLLGIITIIGLADAVTRYSAEANKLPTWMFIILYAITIGFMWW